METNRLYNKEKIFFFLRLVALLTVFLIVALSIFFLIPDSTSTLEKSLENKNYEELYKIVENPDFSKETFTAYMDYNFGEKIHIIDKEKDGKTLSYRVEGTHGEKKLSFTRKSGRYLWSFDDYVYNWNLNVPSGAKLFIGNKEFKIEEGKCVIEQIPFAVYPIRVEGENYKTYTGNILAGQNFEVKLDPSPEFIKRCKGYLTDYFKFKEALINDGKVIEIACVDKASGVYSEVIAEAEMVKGEDIKVTKKISEFEIEKFYFDSKMNVNLEVYESWNVEITNQGQPSMKPEEYKNRYTFSFKEPVRILQITTIR